MPGLAVAMLRGEQVLAAVGLGWADVERRVRVTLDTPFDVASVSKPISAVLALRLAEQGHLDLDRPLRDDPAFLAFVESARAEDDVFFRDYHAETLTLRHLLTMTANGVPGTRFLYNPPSFSWASRPVARAAGRAFSALVTGQVFDVAGMTRSARVYRALPLPAYLEEALARPYRRTRDGPRRSTPPPAQGDGAAGGVISTVADLARFDGALSAGLLLSEASMRTWWTPGRSPSGASLPYGLGWFVGSWAGRRVVWHTGLWEDRYSALYLKVPDEALTLILLANSDGLRWPSRLDEAALDRSAFARLYLRTFPQTPGEVSEPDDSRNR